MTADELALGSTLGREESRRGPGGLRQFWWRLCLKPYGEALCTPGASFWIFSARIAIFIMAAAEAISWSYLGYYIGESSQPYVTAAIAGIAIFSVIWIVDASFITLDTSRAKDEAALFGRVSDARMEKIKLAGGLLIRVFIISATLFISAPFLAQLVFYRDISAEMNRRDATLIAEKRVQVGSAFDARVSELMQLRTNLESASIAEASGAGATRRMGRGPAVATIERRLDEIDRQIAATRAEKEGALRAYDALGKADLQKRYGLEFGEDGIRARGEILGALTANATYANAEMAIRGFLAFLFLALLVLKLFQPASVSVYFSEAFQDLYGQYRVGSFDAWLAPQERSYAKAMTPLRFRDWALGTYRNIRDEDEQQRRLAATRLRAEELLRLRRTAEAEAEPARNAFEAMTAKLGQLHGLREEHESLLATAREELARHERDLASMDETLRSGITGESFVRATEVHAMMERRVGDARAKVRSAEIELSRVSREIYLVQSKAESLKVTMDSRGGVLDAIDQQLTRASIESIAAPPHRGELQ